MSEHDMMAATRMMSSVKVMRLDVIDIDFLVLNTDGKPGSLATERNNAELSNKLEQQNISNFMIASSSADTASEHSGIFETMFPDQGHSPCNPHCMNLCFKDIFNNCSAAAISMEPFTKMAI